MRLNLLDFKRKVKKGKEVIVDLLTASIKYQNGQPEIINAFYVGDDMKMRPDLISYTAYGNEDEWDYILKFNGVSNPFAIDEQDLIAIPDLRWMAEQLNDATTNNDEKDIRSQYVDGTKNTEVDVKKKDYDDYVKELKRRVSNTNEVFLPPNISQPGEKEAIISNGKVYLGAKK